MKTPANYQEQKPRAEARGAHAAWGVVKELESRLSPAGAGANKKAVPGDTRDGEKRAVRTLREVLEPATSRQWLLDRKWTKMERAGIDRIRRPRADRSRADSCSAERPSQCPGAAPRNALVLPWHARWPGTAQRAPDGGFGDCRTPTGTPWAPSRQAAPPSSTGHLPGDRLFGLLWFPCPQHKVMPNGLQEALPYQASNNHI